MTYRRIAPKAQTYLAMVEELGRRIYYSHKEKLPLLGDV
jgi:hypothetical protein